jgi:diguanylate cyclase (GGDEF)-like protein/PAS domain S-box-containing protein
MLGGISPRYGKEREFLDVLVVTALAIFFSLFGLSIHFIEPIYRFFVSYYGTEIAKFAINFIFLYLTGLLWLTYKRWKRAEKRRRELEGVITAIDPDALVVVNAKGEIVMCNKAVEKMFGYTVDEILNRRIDLLYRQDEIPATQWTNMRDVLGREGFHIEYATGRKKSGEPLVLEIVQGDLTSFDGTVSLIRDVTARKRAEDAINQAYGELDQIFNTAADGMWVIDNEFFVLRVNDTLVKALGLEKTEIVGRRCHEIIDCPFYLKDECSMARIAAGHDRFESEVRIPSPRDGMVATCLLTVAPFRHTDGTLMGIIEDFRDVTALKELEERLRTMSLHDELTGLYNRRGFLTLAEQQIKTAQRSKKGMILFFIDLDRMKWINDTFGHNEGDRALMEAAEILKATMRGSDIVARVGGDEFVVLALDAVPESVSIIEERCASRVAVTNRTGTLPYTLSLSIGNQYFDPECPVSIDELIHQADTAMYDQKRRKYESGYSLVKGPGNLNTPKAG